VDELVAFLTACIDEDEAAANVATAPGFSPEWAVHSKPPLQQIRASGLPVASGADSVLPHIARHDPDRVKREVEAKRRIIAEMEGFSAEAEGDEPDQRGAIRSTALHVVKLLALPYADHADYREEWRP
jgi:hypothetical protein